MKILITLLMALSFLTGVLICYAAKGMYLDKESPFLIGLGSTNQQPSDWITSNNIEVHNDKVIIYVKDASLSQYANSGSMQPTFGDNANGIRIKPESANQINIGDIITYDNGNGLLIVHRVVAKGTDSNGIYFVTKGDNNSETDGKVYWSQVRYVTIGVVY